jgi:hypothetical protein
VYLVFSRHVVGVPQFGFHRGATVEMALRSRHDDLGRCQPFRPRRKIRRAETPQILQAFDRFVPDSMSGHDLLFRIARSQMASG